METDWTAFWKLQKDNFHEIMVINTNFFAQRFLEEFSVSASTKILDFGCGPGLLIDKLQRKTNSIVGMDINTNYLEECRAKHPKISFYLINKDGNEIRDEISGQLNSSTFNYIILLSVAQYFKDEKDLRRIVRELSQHLSKNGKLILADVVDINTSTFSDLTALCKHAVQNGKSIALIKFLFYLLFSSYREISAKKKLLKIEKALVDQIAEDNTLELAEMPNLTIHISRRNYIFTKR